MNDLKKACTSTLLLLSFLMGGDGIAQTSIGQWRDHLSYKKGISITQSQNNIYCASESGIYTLEKYDYSINRLSKITGLSDIGVSTLDYNAYNNTLLIAYKNANIDLVADKNIYNLPDIKRSIVTAKKTINNIHFRNEIAYLACGFGIVVLNMDKKEIKDTYYIGVNGGFINVRDITSDADTLYAATDSGVYRASFNAPNLADFKSWRKFASLPKGVYNTITSFGNNIYVNRSESTWGLDTIFSFDGTLWQKAAIDTPAFLHLPVKKLETGANKLLIASIAGTDIFDTNLVWLGRINNYSNFDAYQSIVDNNNSDVIWIADHNNGIVKSYQIFNNDNFYPNGPNTSESYAMSISGGDLWVARGSRNGIWDGNSREAEAYKFSNESWSSTTKMNIPALDTIRDIVSVAIDPANKEHVYLGSLGAGLIEINNGSLVNIWNEQNSTLQGVIANGGWVGIFGCVFDKDGNLWVSNAKVDNPISVRKSDGTWQSFNSSGIAAAPTAGQIIVSQSNQKWVVLARGTGILVFDENGTWATGDDKMKKLTKGSGSGNLPSSEVFCLAEDNDGEIWVGTNKGIAVFYCADQVFSSSGCEAQQIFIEQDGHTQILLETEVVNAIAIDGANRKWIGTQNSGVYLMSEDGTQQILHFTVDNSPLLSNEILSLAINPKSGEVFFGTADGIISYRNDATEGLEDFTNVYVFPNPVKPGYEGPIAITGLVENADVKITDISGELVLQTKALGGQAIWFGKNSNGERARSGVYLVFCSNDDGSKTYVAKILLVN